MECVCSSRFPSMSRKRTPDAMKSFSWGNLANELKEVLPVFYQVLTECVQKKRRKTKSSHKCASSVVDDSTVVGMCAAILLGHRNKNLNLVQRIMSSLLYSGHALKQVQSLII